VLATLCGSRTGDSLQHGVEIIEADVVCVALSRVEARVPREWLECGRVSAALSQEAIGEAVPQLMRSQCPDARSLADTPNEAPKCLFTTRSLRILPSAHPLRLRYPLLDLYGEDMVVRPRLELVHTSSQLGHDIRIDWHPKCRLSDVAPVDAGRSSDEA
jgi:hypothetical protein